MPVRLRKEAQALLRWDDDKLTHAACRLRRLFDLSRLGDGNAHRPAYHWTNPSPLEVNLFQIADPPEPFTLIEVLHSDSIHRAPPEFHFSFPRLLTFVGHRRSISAMISSAQRIESVIAQMVAGIRAPPSNCASFLAAKMLAAINRTRLRPSSMESGIWRPVGELTQDLRQFSG